MAISRKQKDTFSENHDQDHSDFGKVWPIILAPLLTSVWRSFKVSSGFRELLKQAKAGTLEESLEIRELFEGF